MKKKGLSILLCAGLVACMLTACGKDGESKKTDETQKGTVSEEMITSKDEGASEEIGKQETSTEKNKTVYKISKETIVSPYDDEPTVIEYEYDANGNLLIIHNKGDYRSGNTIDSGVDQWYRYKYDSAGRLYKKEYLRGDEDESVEGATIIESILYEYDEDGNLYKEYGHKVDPGALNYVTEYKSNGEKKVTIEYKNNAAYCSSNYLYDSNHNLLFMIKKRGEAEVVQMHENEYDEKGNLIKHIEEGIKNYTADKDSQISYYCEYTYEYDASGKIIQEKKTYSETYSKTYSETYSKTSYEVYTYEYDKNDNLVKKTVTQSTGRNVGEYTTYEYVTFTK